MNTTKTNRRESGASPFKLALAAAIKAAISNAKADGTTAMGLENLKAVTAVPAGGPLGTNARWVYNEIFNEVAREVAGRFLLTDAWPDYRTSEEASRPRMTHWTFAKGGAK
jgi:hypothetical protein